MAGFERTFLRQHGTRGLNRMLEADTPPRKAGHYSKRPGRHEPVQKAALTQLFKSPGRTQVDVSSIDEVVRRVRTSADLFCLVRVGTDGSVLSKGARSFLGTKETATDAVSFARTIFPGNPALQLRWLRRAQILCQRHELVPIFRITLVSPVDRRIVNLFLISRRVTTFDGTTYLLLHGRLHPARTKETIGTVFPSESCFLGSESAWRVALRDSDHKLLLELDPGVKKAVAAVQTAMENLQGMADVVGLQHIAEAARYQTEALGLPAGKFTIKMVDGKPYRYLSYKDETGVRRYQYVAPA